MNKARHHNQSQHNGLGYRTVNQNRAARYTACVMLVLAATWPPCALAGAQAYNYADDARQIGSATIPTSKPIATFHRTTRYHSGVTNLELEQAVIRAAQQHHVQPALLLAVMKAESSFNPMVISKAGAVGLMQLVPETAIRHGVRHLYDTNENVTGGAKHLRYLLNRFHGNTRLALAAYNAGEHTVDRYGKIPPYKETQEYVKKVLVYYRSYKKDGWIIPVVSAVPAVYTSRPY
jgi:soluble lytic murein transglycosylase-like protein